MSDEVPVSPRWVRRGAAHRAVFGKSSGGYGALIQALKHGDRWGGVACHSGDCAFDVVFRHELGHNWSCGHFVGGRPEGAGTRAGYSS